MGRKLILDTTALIRFERNTQHFDTLDNDDLAIAAISLAEYRTGVERAGTVERAARRARVLDTVTSIVKVLDYTSRTAVSHAQLIAHTIKVGKPRGTHDLIIAAHALETGRIIVSHDARARFHSLPGVIAESV